MVLIPSGKAFTQLTTTQRSPKRFYKYENVKMTEGNAAYTNDFKGHRPVSDTLQLFLISR